MKTMTVKSSLLGEEYNRFKVLVESKHEGLELERTWNYMQRTGATGRHYSAIEFTDPTPEELKELELYKS